MSLKSITFYLIFYHFYIEPIISCIPRTYDWYFYWSLLFLLCKLFMKIKCLSYKLQKHHSIAKISRKFERGDINTNKFDIRIIILFQIEVYKPLQKIKYINRNPWNMLRSFEPLNDGKFTFIFPHMNMIPFFNLMKFWICHINGFSFIHDNFFDSMSLREFFLF